MKVSTKKAGSNFLSLPLLFFILFSLLTTALQARGSGEFSKEYQKNLLTLFEELTVKIEFGDIDSKGAKEALASLRSEYRVEYNDYAGKIDAIIDEVEESKKGALEALNSFTIMQNNLIKAREQVLKDRLAKDMEREQIKQTEQNIPQNTNTSGSGGEKREGGGGSRKKN